MKRIYAAYRDLLGIIFQENPMVIAAVLAVAAIGGALTPFTAWVNAQILNGAVEVARGADFSLLTPYLITFVVASLLPNLRTAIIWQYAEPRSQLILRTEYKGRMIEKLKKLRYEQPESARRGGDI